MSEEIGMKRAPSVVRSPAQARRQAVRGIPNLAVYNAVVNTMRGLDGVLCKPSELMALAYCETHCIGYFCASCGADKQELLRLPLKSESERKEFLRYNVIKAGLNRGRVARFSYSPEDAAYLLQSRAHAHLSNIEVLSIACKWGLFLQRGYLVTLLECTLQPLAKLQEFQGSPAMQVRRAIDFLDDLLRASSGDFAVAASKWHGDSGGLLISPFGMRAQREAERFLSLGCV